MFLVSIWGFLLGDVEWDLKERVFRGFWRD